MKTKTSWKPNQSGNPKGRPKKGDAVADLIKRSRHNGEMVKKLYKVAGTLGTKNEHKQALACAKILLDKIVPDLKSQELQVENTNPGYVLLPTPIDVTKVIDGEIVQPKELK
tara:strand:+ start:1047 stop:1382 length:336 start_codon:yes stop_codon:yes gene_type:complete